MATSDATLTNTNVNGGTAVVLGAERINFNWNNIINENTVPNKYDIAEVGFSGFEAPIITVRGTIPVDNLPNNHLTQELLVEFACVNSGDTYLKVTAGVTGGTVLGGRPSGGYETDGTMSLDTTNGIKVQIRSFSINFSASKTREGQAWNYQLNLVETL